MEILKEFSGKQIAIMAAGIAVAVGILFIPEIYLKVVAAASIIYLSITIAVNSPIVKDK